MSSNFLLDVGFCCIIFKKVGLWELSGGTVVKTQPSHCGDPGQGTMILQAPGHDQKTKTKNKLDFFFFLIISWTLFLCSGRQLNCLQISF